MAGYDVVAERGDVRRNIGLVFQDTTLDDYLTAAENLRFHAELYGVPKQIAGQRLQQVLEMVGLWDRRDSITRTFSGGMKRRLEIARGLLHSPRVLFLDEPTVGLDPQTRLHIWTYINELKRREQITMFLTTHYMEEAEYCDRIAIMDNGVIVVTGTPEELKAGIGKDRVELRIRGKAVGVFLIWPELRGWRLGQHALWYGRAERVAVTAELVNRGLHDVLEDRVAARHVSIESAVPGWQLRLVASAQHDVAELVRQRVQDGGADARLKVLFSDARCRAFEGGGEDLLKATMRRLDREVHERHAEELGHQPGVFQAFGGGVS